MENQAVLESFYEFYKDTFNITKNSNPQNSVSLDNKPLKNVYFDYDQEYCKIHTNCVFLKTYSYREDCEDLDCVHFLEEQHDCKLPPLMDLFYQTFATKPRLETDIVSFTNISKTDMHLDSIPYSKVWCKPDLVYYYNDWYEFFIDVNSYEANGAFIINLNPLSDEYENVYVYSGHDESVYNFFASSFKNFIEKLLEMKFVPDTDCESICDHCNETCIHF